ncbi:E3 ubiquitin-protein ligase DCST1-like isoform X1 [Dreissena polymorpha]|nr:E3 ubiquitin-protein ligase DCST1-like isoform X1 [Dreissena polymorpha]
MQNPMYEAAQADNDVICTTKDLKLREAVSEKKQAAGIRNVRFNNPVSVGTHGDVTEWDASRKNGNLDLYNRLKEETHMLFHTGRDENPKIKAAFGILSGLLTGLIFLVILRFTFDYTYLQAGIITVVYTVIVCIGLALSSLCRCIMAILVPNFFTGKGRAILLSIIFGVMLSGPIANISHNFKESGNSLACSVDLIKDQLLVLQRKLDKPVKDIILNVNKKKEALEKTVFAAHRSITEAQSTLKEISQTLATAGPTLEAAYQECQKPFNDFYRTCSSGCLFGLPCPCNEAKDFFDGLCNNVRKTSDNFVTTTATKTMVALDDALKLFTADVDMRVFAKGGANSSKTSKTIQEEINKEVDEKVNVLQMMSFVTTKVLSVTLLIIFIQSFLYIKSYLAKDGYDNVYITKGFRSFDAEQERLGQTSLLPLKKSEHTKYVDTRSWKLNSFELTYCTTGLAQVFLHFIFCVTVVLFDYVLFYIMNLVRIHGSLELGIQGKGTLKIIVHGDGPVKDFYEFLFQGLDINEGFTSNLHLSRCLPSPIKPYDSNIPVFLVLYLVAIGVVCLRGYGMRLRRKISAYYYPEQEKARITFLHKTIRNRRAGVQRFLRQQVRSTHKECTIKEQLRISTWLRSNCQCLDKVLPNRNQRKCTSCGQTGKESGSTIINCADETTGKTCKAMYCGDCKAALAGMCPLCCDNDVVLRD